MKRVWVKSNSFWRDAIKLREAHTTAVYNYFSSPPARRQFCAAALEVASSYQFARPEDFAAFAQTGLARYELAFEDFFTAYDAYERDSAAWDAKWGALYGASQPGWVALYGNAPGAAAAPAPEVAAEVLDPVTGVANPVIPVDDSVASTPVVQPVPTDTAGGGQ